MPAATAAMPSPHPSTTFEEFCAAGLWPGVGPALREQMAEAGIDDPDKVTEDALAELPSVTDKRARRLFTAWVGARHLYDVALVLVPHRLPVRWVRRLAEALGDAAASALVADPWSLLILPDASVAQADGLARSLQPDVRPDDPRRLKALVTYSLRRQARRGHTVSPRSLVADDLREHGVTTAALLNDAVRAAVDADLVRTVPDPQGGPSGPADGGASADAGSGDRWLAGTALAEAEDAIARHIRRLRDKARPIDTSHGPDATDLDTTQRAAVEAAAAEGVSVLTGGPGTGKSRTVTAVVALCRAAGVSVALAAPTGRAAKRLSELLAAAASRAVDGDGPGPDQPSSESGSADAMTIHRLLGARRAPDGQGSIFESDESDPIDAEMIVIDEASMLDVELASALLRAIPDGAHLMIVGDPAQLPSIGPGQVLGDILTSGACPITELTTLYRQHAGGAIARLATAVRGGELAAPDADDHEVVVVPAAGSADAAKRVGQLVTDAIPRVFGLPPEQIQVVTPVHRGPAGTIKLNTALKSALNPGPHRGRTVRGFDIGDRVVATANYLDAEPTGYANGEIGTIVDTSSKSVLVAFPGGESEISGKALGDLLHGWAVTVHRAQGSEWEAVVVVLPPEAGRMLSRPLVYTALTRARRHLSVVHAAGPMLVQSVRHIGATPRRTRLASLLAAPSPSAGGEQP